MTPVYKLMERGEGKEGDRGRGRRERREERERGERERERDWAKWTDLMLSSDEPRHPFPRWIISAPLNHRPGGAERSGEHTVSFILLYQSTFYLIFTSH